MWPVAFLGNMAKAFREKLTRRTELNAIALTRVMTRLRTFLLHIGFVEVIRIWLRSYYWFY